MIETKLNSRLYQKLGKTEFGIREVQRVARLTYGSAKVMLNRLKNNGQVLKTRHGQYVLIKPENWIGLQRIRKNNPKLYRLAITLYQRFPKLGMFVLYGSQVTGYADKYSDFDVLVVVPSSTEKTSIIKKELEKKLRIKLHLTVYSQRAFETLVISEPYLKFWLTEGIVLDERAVLNRSFKTVAKLAYLENLETVENYIDIAKKETDSARKTRYYFTALKMLLMTKEALNLNYNYMDVRRKWIDKVGKISQRIRQRKNIKQKELERLIRLCRKEFKEVTCYLKQVGENEADLYWKQELEEDKHE